MLFTILQLHPLFGGSPRFCLTQNSIYYEVTAEEFKYRIHAAQTRAELKEQLVTYIETTDDWYPIFHRVPLNSSHASNLPCLFARVFCSKEVAGMVYRNVVGDRNGNANELIRYAKQTLSSMRLVSSSTSNLNALCQTEERLASILFMSFPRTFKTFRSAWILNMTFPLKEISSKAFHTMCFLLNAIMQIELHL